MKTTTFYSYKGGLGRSLLLAWSARQLEREKHSVVAIDLDLEAPGLPYKFGFKEADDLGPGVIDLIARFQRGERPPASLKDWLRLAPGSKQLWLLPAGPRNGRLYLRSLSSISWEALFRGAEPQGPRFFTWLKDSIAADPSPDHLLVDARTGVTEMGGAALAVMADQVLALVGTAPEGLDGTRDVLQNVASFSHAARRRAPRFGVALARVPATLLAVQIQTIRKVIQAKIEREPIDISSAVKVGLPIVVRSEPKLQISESLALYGGSLVLDEDYQSVLDWLEGQEAPASPPSLLGTDLGTTEALRATVSLLRERADESDESHLQLLAESLENLSAFEAARGRRDTAMDALKEAVRYRRALAAARPDAFMTELSRSLANLSIRFANLGKLEEALAASEEVVLIYRGLAAARPEAVMPDLAMSLSNVSVQLSDLGRREEALAASDEAVRLYRRLVATRPDEFTDNLATSLNNLSIQLSDLGKAEEALAAIEEAVSHRRALATQHPDIFKPALATTLNNLSNRLSDLGRQKEALGAIEEAVSHRRTLAAQRPDALTHDLAASLNNLGNRLLNLGRLEEALAAIEEAVSRRRELAARHRDTYGPDLAQSLNNLSVVLLDLGRPEAALAAIDEAVNLYRVLASGRPGAFAQVLAQSLNNLSGCLGELGRSAEGLAVSREALGFILEPLRKWPAAVGSTAQEVRLGYLKRCSELGREPETVLIRPVEEVLERYRPEAV